MVRRIDKATAPCAAAHERDLDPRVATWTAIQGYCVGVSHPARLAASGRRRDQSRARGGGAAAGRAALLGRRRVRLSIGGKRGKE